MRTIADPNNLQLLFKAIADAGNHVVDQRSKGSGHRPCCVIRGADLQDVVGLLHAHGGMQFKDELAFWPLNAHCRVVEFDFDTARNINRAIGYTGHYKYSKTQNSD